jgi:hypothetical protein
VRLTRILAVTAGLAATGALIGAILSPILLFGGLLVLGGPDALPPVGEIVPFAAAVGGVIGGILAPTAAWLLMRHVPLWRAIGETALGTSLGAAVGFFMFPGPFVFAVLGFLAAALRLRLLAPRRREEVHASIVELSGRGDG